MQGLLDEGSKDSVVVCPLLVSARERDETRRRTESDEENFVQADDLGERLDPVPDDGSTCAAPDQSSSRAVKGEPSTPAIGNRGLGMSRERGRMRVPERRWLA